MQHCSKYLTLIKNQIIKKIAAFAMLIVFAVSITPSIIFHDLFANHTDSVKKTSNPNPLQFGKKLFNCHCDNIVAESPFTQTAAIIILPGKQHFTIAKTDNPAQFSSTQPIYKSLRGPPVV